MIENILLISLCVSSTICLWSAFLLFHNGREVKQQRWLALVLSLWGIAWAARAYGLFFKQASQIYSEVLPTTLIITGIITSVIFLLWLLSVVNPSGLSFRKFIIYWTPMIICVAIYYIGIFIFCLDRFAFTSLSDFLAHISYFSAWYRLVMCACLLGYLIYTIERSVFYIKKYNRYVEENYSEYEKYTIRWLPGYLEGLVMISVFYFLNLFLASYLTFLLHNLVACIFLGWLATKIMVYKSPFTSEVMVPEISEPILSKAGDFNSMFENYKKEIEEWMTTERPYLNPEFRLQDIIKRYGLNRTYASRIFNEGFRKSFILTVREYRIEYAKNLIKENPAIAMSEVAHLCGYSTVQAFHKAFAYCNGGMTPGKFAATVSSRNSNKSTEA